jgi:hypothetical protein
VKGDAASGKLMWTNKEGKVTQMKFDGKLRS